MESLAISAVPHSAAGPSRRSFSASCNVLNQPKANNVARIVRNNYRGSLLWKSKAVKSLRIVRAVREPCVLEHRHAIKGLREECGVAGVYGDEDASKLCCTMMQALQHRGQDGAGIASLCSSTQNLITHKDLGLVSHVFTDHNFAHLPGSSAIGHVRYATAGATVRANVQPLTAPYDSGSSVALAHNGNLVNYLILKKSLEEQGSILSSTSDTEVILHLIARSKQNSFILKVKEAAESIRGAFSLVFLTEDNKMVAFRDPHGFRPLVIGKRPNGSTVIASETCALDAIDARYVREVHPGEILVIDDDGMSSIHTDFPDEDGLRKKRAACIFELIYFAHPNSIVFGKSVYKFRKDMGRILAEESPAECDVVISVPDSGTIAAIGYAEAIGANFEMGLVKNPKCGRSFIEPDKGKRVAMVKRKHRAVREVVDGKSVVVVDDSVVRGTTSVEIVEMLREAGAAQVHLRIASPSVKNSCYYGVDTPCKEELISNRLSLEETRVFVGADSLAFVPLERLREMVKDDGGFCDACFSGSYPVPPLDVIAAKRDPRIFDAGP